MRRRGNIIFWVVVVVLVFAALYTFYNKNKENVGLQKIPEAQSQQSTVDSDSKKPQVPEFELKDINGNAVKLGDYKGKVVVLNFWTTWCKYCVAEMHDFDELSREFNKAGDAVMLGVNVQEDESTVKNYLKSAGLMNLTVLMDKSGEVANTYGVSGYPNTYIINKDGTLYEYIPGATNKETVESLVNKIR
jgi:peroxiredoxin